jgi:hypothetical protein
VNHAAGRPAVIPDDQSCVAPLKTASLIARMINPQDDPANAWQSLRRQPVVTDGPSTPITTRLRYWRGTGNECHHFTYFCMFPAASRSLCFPTGVLDIAAASFISATPPLGSSLKIKEMVCHAFSFKTDPVSLFSITLISGFKAGAPISNSETIAGYGSRRLPEM